MGESQGLGLSWAVMTRQTAAMENLPKSRCPNRGSVIIHLTMRGDRLTFNSGNRREDIHQPRIGNCGFSQLWLTHSFDLSSVTGCSTCHRTAREWIDKQILNKSKIFNKSKCSEKNGKGEYIVVTERYSARPSSKRRENDKSSHIQEITSLSNKSSLLILSDGWKTIASISLKQAFHNDENSDSYRRDAVNSIFSLADKSNSHQLIR
jgi:hypothetical protein